MTALAPERRSHRWLAPVAALALLAPAAATGRPKAAPAPAVDARAAGLRIYREGVLPSGKPLEGTAQRGIPRVGPDAACAACHRRSGFGASEGPIRIPSIAASALFGWRESAPAVPVAAPAPASVRTVPANSAAEARAARMAARTARIAAQRGPERRPPYDDASLARAIREGVDVTGRPLAPGMPRYALRDEEMKSLVAYLRTLSADPAPGVSEEEIHLATVLQPGVDPAKRRAMLEVMQAFVRDKNAGTRSEVQRREAGTEREYRAYRKWVLHVWDLTGPADGWGAQLDALYARDPVFALMGGLGPGSWRPIHDWSERLGVPCLFPQSDLPAPSAGFYTVYLSRGISLEAEALAKYLLDRGERRPVVQVFRDDEESAAAASAFRAAMRAGAGTPVDERRAEGPIPRTFWERLATERPGATLVLWLGAGDLAEAGALVEVGSAVEGVFLSTTMLGDGPRGGLAAGGDARVRLVHPEDLPRSRGARLLKVKRWLHEKGIALSDERVQMNAYFAVAVTADVVTHMADLFSREFLVERVEHAVGNTVAPSIYPRVSLGPDQRFASKGSYIVKVTGAGELEPVSGWITP